MANRAYTCTQSDLPGAARGAKCDFVSCFLYLHIQGVPNVVLVVTVSMFVITECMYYVCIHVLYFLFFKAASLTGHKLSW